jgi:hypothetical protein
VRRLAVRRILLILPLLYACWLLMMAVHESGHVLHAWLSGGRVAAVHFGPLEFSRTELADSPHPRFVAWGGPLWGSLIPLIAYGLATALRLRRPGRLFLCFFAGFCLIANGAYIGLGWIDAAGDAGTLLRHGASPWTMAVTGLAAVALGLYLWHSMGPRFGLAAPCLARGGRGVMPADRL